MKVTVSLALAVLILAAIFVLSRDRSTSVASGQPGTSPSIVVEHAEPQLEPIESSPSREAALPSGGLDAGFELLRNGKTDGTSAANVNISVSAWVEGFVRDVGGNPIQGAQITLEPRAGAAIDPGPGSSRPNGRQPDASVLDMIASTDGSGRFRVGIAAVSAAETPVSLTIEHCAFQVAERSMTLERGRTISDVQIALLARDLEVWGTILDDRGLAVTGATIADNEIFDRSDATGVFRLPCARGDQVQSLEASAPGHPPLRVTRDEVGGNWRGVQLKFPKGTIVRGRVVDERGRAVANARVLGKAIGGGSWLPGGSVTGADGHFEVGALPSGDVVVQAWKEVSDGRWQPWVGAILELKDGETRELDLAFGAEPAGPVPVGPVR